MKKLGNIIGVIIVSMLFVLFAMALIWIGLKMWQGIISTLSQILGW